MSHSQYESLAHSSIWGWLKIGCPKIDHPIKKKYQKHFCGVVPDWSGRMYATGVVPHRCHRAACWCCHLSPRLRTGSYWASEEVVLQGGAWHNMLAPWHWHDAYWHIDHVGRWPTAPSIRVDYKPIMFGISNDGGMIMPQLISNLLTMAHGIVGK